MVCGVLCVVCGECGVWCVVSMVSVVRCGWWVWCVVCGVWCIVCCEWCVVCCEYGECGALWVVGVVSRVVSVVCSVL